MPGERKLIGQILKEMELISEDQLQEALALQRDQGGLIGEILVSLGYVAQEEVHLALAAQIGMTVLDLFVHHPEMLECVENRREKLVFEDVGEIDDDSLAASAPVTKLVDLAVTTALGADATEIRFEESGGKFDIRYRVAGVLYDMESPPWHLAEPVLARLRHLTGLTAIRRERLVTARLGARRFGVAAASLPTADGESVILEFSPLLR